MLNYNEEETTSLIMTHPNGGAVTAHSFEQIKLLRNAGFSISGVYIEEKEECEESLTM